MTEFWKTHKTQRKERRLLHWVMPGTELLTLIRKAHRPASLHAAEATRSMYQQSKSRHTLCVFDKHLVHIIYFAQAGSPALLSFLLPLGAVGVTPHELVVVQRAISRALGIAPSAATA